MYTYYEFFSGGGMARAGLGNDWSCAFANDIDAKKMHSYVCNWGKAEALCADISDVMPSQLPGIADLAWASFPCQDLSLAGAGAGLAGERSGTFWPFWELLLALKFEQRAPKTIVLENVCGALTSHGGDDFLAICNALADANYYFGAVVIDAVHFLPQSRPRLFIIAVRDDLFIDSKLQQAGPSDEWHPKVLRTAANKLPNDCMKYWRWWQLPTVELSSIGLDDLIETRPTGVSWHTQAETKKLLNMMDPLHLARVQQAKQIGGRQIGMIYRRTRTNAAGEKRQRAEVRFDDIAGCLRTPTGGSSRQIVMIVEGQSVRSRLLSTREAARLMGLSEDYQLPERYNEAYHLIGDGVAVPVVRFLASNLIEKLLFSQSYVLGEAV